MPKWKQPVVFALLLGALGAPAVGQQQPPRRKKAAAPGAPAAREASQVWKVLLIIKPRTEVAMEGLPEMRTGMTSEDVAAIERVFTKFTPGFVRDVSGGRLAWKADVVVSSTPITHVTKNGDGNWVAPGDVAADLAKVDFGDYDNIFVYWRADDPVAKTSLNPGFGWSIGPSPEAKYAGYSCVHYAPAGAWSRDSETSEVFLHEWLHPMEPFYTERGVKLPRDGLHGAGVYGFDGKGGYKDWYRAFITGTVKEPDGSLSGLGEAAWRQGTIREAALVYSPRSLTAERLRRNLLKNASFEGPLEGTWAGESYRGSRDSAGVDASRSRTGASSLRIKPDPAKGPDDTLACQEVTVKPNRRYLLSGWIRTQAVTVGEKGEPGEAANLSVVGGFEGTGMVGRTTDWTYVAAVIDSKERTSLKVACRLGHYGRVALGDAWFDDLTLIDLGPTRPEGSRPSPPAAGP